MEIRDVSKLIYKIKLIENKVTKLFEEKTGLSLTRYEMLLAIYERGKLSQIELQQFLKIDNAAITRHLKILEEKNYVFRCRNPKNNREIFVSLTDYAISQISSCEKNCPNLSSFFNIDFNETDAKQLLILLEKFEKSIK